jgi:putative endopeptidase
MKYSSLFKIIFAGIIGVAICVSCSPKNTNMKDQALLLEDLDTTVRPQDDFYQYATGGWQNNHPLPDEETRFGSFDILAKETNQKAKDLIVELSKTNAEEGSLEWKIGTFYSVGMDSAKIEAQGLKPLTEEFERIQNIEDVKDVISQFAYNSRAGIGSIFYVYGSADSENSDMQITNIHQGGIGLPDRDYYLSDDSRSEEIRTEYVRYMTNMFVLLGDEAEVAEANAMSVMNIETRLAEKSMSRVQQRDPHAVNNKMNLDELEKLSGNFDFTHYFKGVGLDNIEVINVRQPEFFAYLGTMIDDVTVDEWQTYFRWCLINGTSGMLSSQYGDMNFNFYGKFLRGQEVQKARWRRIVGATNSALGEAVGQKFVEQYFPQEAKERMEVLVANLQDAFRLRIKSSTWMSKETQEKALAKLDVMRVKIGYPDKWRDYSGLEISTDSYVENMFSSNRFGFDYMISKIGKAVDKEEWHMSPQTVNAYYSPQTNEICFPAGILQPPFFYMNADDAVNYGAIGVVIGHEMTHGFDDQGRNFDLNGNLKTWWTDADAASFDIQAQILIDRYDDFIVIDTVHANGELSLGENIADFGGLTISHTAFLNSLKGKEEPAKINGFTADQRFYLAYAKVWAQNIRDKEILSRTKEDVHSLGVYRVNGQLPGIEAFQKAFDVKAGDAMYLPEENWTKIW